MIVVTVFLSILNQIEFYLVQNQNENYHHDDIPFNLKGNGILVFSVYLKKKAIFPHQGNFFIHRFLINKRQTCYSAAHLHDNNLIKLISLRYQIMLI